MSRKKKRIEREIMPDILYNNIEVSKFINIITISGKKLTAQNIVYKAFNHIRNKLKKNPINVFSLALDNVSPMIEIKNRKFGGSSYNIPTEIRNSRRISLSMKWIKDSSRSRSERYMYLRLANELLDASMKRGKSIKKREDIHKMAESNRAYSHYYG